MGLGKSDLELLLTLRQQGALKNDGRIAELGAQQLNNSFVGATSELRELGQLYGKTGGYTPPLPLPTIVLAGGHEHQPENAPYSRAFWEWLGYRYTAIDIDESPGVIALDLNYDDVPRNARNQFDLVTNYGTTEHVANQLQAFKVIHDLTAVGGVMIHNLPAQGHFNHGLINYNPKFFWMLARSNDYEWLHMGFSANEERYALPENIIADVARFDAGTIDKIKRYEGTDAGIVVVLRKRRDMDYVAPIDVPSGGTTSDSRLRERYWTVFSPGSHRDESDTTPEIKGRLRRRLMRAIRNPVAAVRRRLTC